MKPVKKDESERVPGKDSSVIEQLRHGGWQTGEELSLASRKDMVAVLDELDSPANRNSVLMVRSPGPGAEAMFHVVTPSTANLPKMPRTVSVTRLPWHLKKSALAKAVKLLQNEGVYHSAPDLVMTTVALEEMLVEMDLRSMRRRPREGFLYQCSWNAGYGYDPKAASSGSSGAIIQPCLTFIGILGVRDVFRYKESAPDTRRLPGVHIVDDYPGLLVIGSAVGATVRLSGILPVDVSARLLKPVKPPTRREIIAETRERLLDAAEKRESVRPFVPIRGFTFRLL